jgi:hypothetical protein
MGAGRSQDRRDLSADRRLGRCGRPRQSSDRDRRRYRLNGAKIEIVFADHQGNPPVGVDSATSDARFLIELKQAGQKIQTVAFVVEAGDDAAAMSAPVRNALRAAGFEVAADIG